ncbi:hypothetical protein NC652_034507 [Populus alba x Populus x berolinensis]|nr:hypothetical protein NC652_034507 [Populus alba x Populus x berolinensis]
MQHEGGGGEGVDEGNEAWSERTLKLRPFLQFTEVLFVGLLTLELTSWKSFTKRYIEELDGYLSSEVQFSCSVAYVIETSRVEAIIEQN